MAVLEVRKCNFARQTSGPGSRKLHYWRSSPRTQAQYLKLDPNFLHFRIRQKPDQRFIVQIDHLDAVAPGVAKIAAKSRLQFQTVLLLHLFAHLSELFLVAHDESKMTDPVRLDLLDFENGEKLVLTQFHESVAFAAIHLLQIKDILIKFHRRSDIIHFDRDVFESINLHAHE